MIQSLIWRVSFPRGANIICQTILLFPLLVLKYFFGYQTPFFDFVQTKLYQAKIKENLNDSYFETLLGYDTNGEKFDSGAGGTERKQKIKATELAIRRSTVKIRTANSTRHAEIFISKSQETDTDKQIEQVLAGLGDRLAVSNIRFQENPNFSPDRGGYIFDSDVPYNPGEELGSWKAIFANPFASENKISNGGRGAVKTFILIIEQVLNYIVHLTPPAVLEKVKKS